MVTREEVQQRLWPGDTYVEFDRSLNTAVKRLREALGDSAGRPRFVETLPRRGYRFVAPVEGSSGDVQPGLAAQPTPVPPVPSEELAPKRKLRFQQALFGVTAIALLALAFVHFRQTPLEVPQAPMRRFAISLPMPLVDTYTTDLAISPNARHIAFTSAGTEGELWIQDLDRRQPRVFEGTEAADKPFWSPGSDFVGLFSFSQRELKKISVQGGPAIWLCKVPGPAWGGGSWSPDGESIVFSSGSPPGLYEVPASGGAPRLVVSPEESEVPSGASTGGIYWPHFLPSGAGPRVLVYAFGSRYAPTMTVQDLESGRREFLGPGTRPIYSPSGHIIYQASELIYDLWALPFSLDTLQATGTAFRISAHSHEATVGADGTLVYREAPVSRRQLVWLDRGGEKTGEIGQAQQEIRYPVLSPDGRLVAVAAGERFISSDLWVHDLARGVRTRLSPAPDNTSKVWTPAWSPTGEEVAFTTMNRAGNFDIFLRNADGSGEATALAATPAGEFLQDWSRDGKYLLYEVLHPQTRPDLWYLERNERGGGWEPRLFLQTPFLEEAAQFSPDGRYVAYVSDESGKNEVYVRPFPSGSGKSTISSHGGRQPRWSRDGKELFYVEGSTLMAVSVSLDPIFSAGATTPLFEPQSLVSKT